MLSLQIWPLASIGKHPLIGLAAAYAGVACIFTVNFIATPTDAMLTEITNESIALAGGQPISIVANWFFNIGSSFVLALVATVVTNRLLSGRSGGHSLDELHDLIMQLGLMLLSSSDTVAASLSG